MLACVADVEMITTRQMVNNPTTEAFAFIMIPNIEFSNLTPHLAASIQLSIRNIDHQRIEPDYLR